MAFLGMATSVPACFLIRFAGGLCNGLWCVLKSAVAEIVTDGKGQSRAFALMVIAMSTGAIVGPTLGGILAGISGSQRPFALPCLTCAGLQLCLSITGIALFPRPPPADESKEDVYTVKDDARYAALESAVDGDTIELRTTQRRHPSVLDIFDDNGDDDEKTIADETTSSLSVYDAGGTKEASRRRFKIAKDEDTPLSLERSGTLNAMAGLLDQMVTVSEALVLTSPREDGGAELSEQTAGLCFGAAAVAMLIWVATGLPATTRIVRGSQLRLFQGAEVVFALGTLILPLVAVIPSSSAAIPRRHTGGPPEMPLNEVALILNLGLLNCASATALISASVLVQQTLATYHPTNLGKGNGKVQFWINAGRVSGPVLAGLAFDLANHLVRRGTPGPCSALTVLALLAFRLAHRFGLDDTGQRTSSWRLPTTSSSSGSYSRLRTSAVL